MEREIPERLRAFVAIRLSIESEETIASLIAELRALGGNLSWTARTKLHLTLRFLGGAAGAEMIRALDPALAQIASIVQPFELRASGVGAFPNMRRPRVVWIGTAAEPVSTIAGQIEAAAQACGFSPEPRPYSPHLTIGRVRDLRGWTAVRERLEGAVERDFGVSTIEAIALYRSHLGRDGAAYEELARYRLGGFSGTTNRRVVPDRRCERCW